MLHVGKGQGNDEETNPEEASDANHQSPKKVRK